MGRAVGVSRWGCPPEVQDTRGPVVYFVRRMIEQAEKRRDRNGRRDAAILHLLYDLGLRRGEVTRLDLSDLEDGGLWVSMEGNPRSQDAVSVGF